MWRRAGWEWCSVRAIPGYAGGDLRRVLEREGVLSADRAAGFISPVASALDAAYAAGLVHRDVKPGNILVDARAGRPDHVYLSDFGASKGAVTSVSLTGQGFLGTPDYAAPEQINGGAVDGRSIRAVPGGCGPVHRGQRRL
jgi:serine/threonine-protein kinase